jgi:addiction module HigA family antidote
MNNPTHRPPSSPGEILKELFLKPAGISQIELARHLGWTAAKVNNIISGKLGVSAETAMSLADAFGTTPQVWMNAQAAIDLWNTGRKHVPRKRIKRSSRPAA